MIENVRIEVIDDKTGDVLQVVKSYGEAVTVCDQKGLNYHPGDTAPPG